MSKTSASYHLVWRAAAAAARDAVHLREQLRLEAARRLVLAGAAARRDERVDLVEEEHLEAQRQPQGQ